MTGETIYELIARLYPICRSITGNGVRQTLDILAGIVPLTITEVPSGTKVLDWTIPKEWNINDAYIKDKKGNRIVDFNKSNLHVLNYSVPYHETVSLKDVRDNLYTLPDHPDWIPYKTSYYEEKWGVCLTHNQLLSMQDDEYEICIDSTLQEGSLTYGEFYKRGEIRDEIIISCHICHPSLCNDNLSGIAIAIYLAAFIADIKTRYSYRFLFVPGTIGAIAWLHNYRDSINKIKHGLVLTCVGDSARPTYKKSRRGDTEIDAAVAKALQDSCESFNILDFYPYGYDERQYCSPGFNLPVGTLMRSVHGTFPEYHTSADNLEFINKESLYNSYELIANTIDILETNKIYYNLKPFGEPQLGTYGLYDEVDKNGNRKPVTVMPHLWVLNYSDGKNSLLDIAYKSNMQYSSIKTAAEKLVKCKLLDTNFSQITDKV